MSKLIAIVDDEEDIAELIKLHLKRSNYESVIFSNARYFLEYIKRNSIDFLVLDLMLPDINGIEICKQIRTSKKYPDLPILMLTAKTSEFDKIRGLKLGADDYLTKPFSVHELIARIQSILRRSDQQKKKISTVINITHDLTMNVERFQVFYKLEEVKLTKTEFQILQILAESKGEVLSRQKLLYYLWGDDKIVIERSIDVHIRHLRKKIHDTGQIISSVSGVGYKISS